MEKQHEQQTQRKPAADQSDEEKRSLEGLPMEDSPYVNYKDLEDYKRKGYGTEGNLEPKPCRGAGATDAPTLSGAAVSSEAHLSSATDVINRRGVP